MVPERLRLTVLGTDELVVELSPGDPATRVPGTADVPGKAANPGPAGARGTAGDPGVSPVVVVPQPEVRPLRSSAAERAAGQGRHEVTVDGWVLQVRVEPALQADLRDRAGRAASGAHPHVRQSIRAQIPGRVVRLWVAVGQEVEAGERLLAVEAMKMENEVRAPRAGTVVSISATLGGTVELGDELATVD